MLIRQRLRLVLPTSNIGGGGGNMQTWKINLDHRHPPFPNLLHARGEELRMWQLPIPKLLTQFQVFPQC